jgi:MoxR-like ATPase
MSQKPYACKPDQDEFLRAALAFGKSGGDCVSYAEIDEIVARDDNSLTNRPWWLINSKIPRAAAKAAGAGRGQFMLPELGVPTESGAVAEAAPKKTAPKKKVAAPVAAAPVAPVAAPAAVEPVVAPVMKVSSVTYSAVPEKSKNFVPFGHFKDLKSIFDSGFFYPTFITGMSGNGKTFAVEQAAARSKREMFRVNVTVETDEDDLLGGFRLVDGETRWFDGPVVEAMRRGAILLLDEIDLASNRIMCLQPVLEGKPVLLKKINEVIHPADGFTIVATANTKGKGSDDGRYVGTNVLNDAFLERFAITFEWDYPSESIEKKIIGGTLKSLGVEDSEWAEQLVRWAGITRASFAEDVVSELIATRRLEKIAQAFAIFGDKRKAVELSLNRFDDETKEAFLDLYEKVTGDEPIADPSSPDAAPQNESDVPF